MYFVISCVDKPGQPGLRQDNRPEHLDYLGSHAERIVAAGPPRGAGALHRRCSSRKSSKTAVAG